MKEYRGTVAVCVSAIDKASKIFGSEMALAAALGVSRQILNYWKHNMAIPFDKAFRICVLTHGKVKLNELCPGLGREIKQYDLMVLEQHGHAAVQ